LGSTAIGQEIMSKWIRFFIGLGIVGTAIVVYLVFFGAQTYFVWQAHRAARKEPMYWVKPVELSDSSMSEASRKKLSYFGYELEVPWDDIDNEKTRVAAKGIAVIVFRSGNAITFWTSPPNGLIGSISDENKIDRKTVAQVLGNDAAQSDYAFERAAFEMTPDQVPIFSSRKVTLGRWMLFTFKEGLLRGGAESGLFFVTTREFQGFQYGRPVNPPKPMSVELFGKDVHIDVLFGQKLNGPTVISQADVNLVVQSIHELPTQETNPHASHQK
jgi:hypothetical protein